MKSNLLISLALFVPYVKQQAKRINWPTAFAQPWPEGQRGFLLVENDRVCFRTTRPRAVGSELRLKTQTINSRVLEGFLLSTHGVSLSVLDLVSTEPFERRYRQAEDLVRAAESPRVSVMPAVKVRSELDLMVCQREFIEQGYKGAILRHGITDYATSALLSVQTFTPAIFQIVDFKLDAEGIPTFVCITKTGSSFEVVAPGSPAVKRATGTKARSCIGSRLTVAYHSLSETVSDVPYLPVAIGFAK